MSYNAARDELFVADYDNKVVRAIRLQDNAGDMREVFRCTSLEAITPRMFSVCHMSDSDSLLVCTAEHWQNERAYWLVLLRRAGSEWRETHRVHTALWGYICCALSDSRALVGAYNSTSMELFRVQSDARIAHVHRIDVSERYRWLAASSGSDTLVAMSFASDESVRVNRLRDERLEPLARIRLKKPDRLLWHADRLLVTESHERDNDTVTELEVSATGIERRRELIAHSEGIQLHRWCALPDGIIICDLSSGVLLNCNHLFIQ